MRILLGATVMTAAIAASNGVNAALVSLPFETDFQLATGPVGDDTRRGQSVLGLSEFAAQTALLSKFDPALGTLERVDISLESNWSHTLTYGARDDEPDDGRDVGLAGYAANNDGARVFARWDFLEPDIDVDPWFAQLVARDVGCSTVDGSPCTVTDSESGALSRSYFWTSATDLQRFIFRDLPFESEDNAIGLFFDVQFFATCFGGFGTSPFCSAEQSGTWQGLMRVLYTYDDGQPGGEPTPVPEPGTPLLFAGGLALLGLLRRRSTR